MTTLRWQKLPHGQRGQFADHNRSRFVVRKTRWRSAWELMIDGHSISRDYKSEADAKQVAEDAVSIVDEKQ